MFDLFDSGVRWSATSAARLAQPRSGRNADYAQRARRSRSTSVVAWLLVFASALHADAPAMTDLLFRTTQVAEVALAPDGHRVAWEQSNPNPRRSESPGSTLMISDEAGAKGRPATRGHRAGRNEKRPTWSPDGKWLAYLSDEAKARQQDLYLVAAGGGKSRRLTTITGQIERPRWSPDGRTIAVLVIAGLDRPAGAVEAAAPDAGEVAETFYEQRVGLVDVATGAMRFVSPENEYVYEVDWSPDSRQLVCSLAPGSGDNNWWIARLAVLSAGGGPVRELFRPATQVAVPRWSPDGKTIAFIQGLMSDQGSTGGDLWTVPAAGGPARCLTPERPSSVAWLQWLSSGQLLISELVRGGVAIGRFDVATGTTERLSLQSEFVSSGRENYGLSVTPDGLHWAAIRSSWAHPPEVCTGPEWTERTAINAAVLPPWGRSESIEWQSDGHAVQGWLLYPANFDPAKRYPLIVSIHGGPASMKMPAWPQLNFDLSPLAGEGYFVFFPNPRGSYGQGEAFAAANVKDFGFGDLRDILSGLDVVLAKVPVDPARLGVGGWSYGGFMTMWTVTQTRRFHAAVSGAGIANWQSYYGENLIDRWMVPYFGGTVYDDPESYLRSSPIRYIKAVQTPTLILVGDSDKECPAPQSDEFWHALKTLGVKTRYVIYPGEGHHFRRAVHIEDLYRRTLDWYNTNLR